MSGPAKIITTCRDCDEEVKPPFNYRMPATPEQSNLMKHGLYVKRPPLCYRCWAKRTHPDTEPE